MPSIFTLEGNRRRKKAKRSRGLSGALGRRGTNGLKCKCVKNGRTGLSTKLCFFGKKPGKRGSGWKFTGEPCD